MRKRNPDQDGRPPGTRYQIRQRRRRIACHASRLFANSVLSKLQLILPSSIRRSRLFPAALFSEAQPRFHSRFQIVICERSCRMAKTLTVNITPILKKESRKWKKNQKKIDLLAVLLKNTVKKHKKRFKTGHPAPLIQFSGPSLFRFAAAPSA